MKNSKHLEEERDSEIAMLQARQLLAKHEHNVELYSQDVLNKLIENMKTRYNKEIELALAIEKQNKEEASKWIKAGVIGVDAGICWIGDPCYILALPRTREKSQFEDLNKPKELPKDLGGSWHGFCDKVDERMEGSIYPNKRTQYKPYAQFNYDAGHPGLGVVTRTNGDGTYPVYIKKDEDGTVLEVKVVFAKKRNKK